MGFKPPYDQRDRVMHGRPAVLLCFIGALFFSVSCSHESGWALKNISGLMPPLEFAMTDERGHTVDAGNYRGKVVLLYFGYTHCPDVCPTALNRMAGVLGHLGEAAQRVRVLFVTVDPARDSERVLSRYTESFGPQFIGLHGTSQQLRDLARRYRVSYGRGEPDAEGRYPVSHSSAVFIFDATGEPRLLATPGHSRTMVEHDLRRLLALDTVHAHS